MESVWLDDYLTLAETLNFSRAAALRHVSQPAFSRRIRALEAWVGTTLFIRTTHHVALTPAGEHFRAQAEMLRRSLQQVRRDTQAAAGRDDIGITIASTHALSFTFFPRWIRSGDADFARGKLHLMSDTMRACEQIMMRGEAQFMLCHHHAASETRLDPEQFTSIVVGADRLVPLSAPDKSGKARWPLRSEKTIPYLAYSAQSGLGRIIAAAKETELRSQRWQTIFTSDLAAALLTMARAGQGFAWLPYSLAEDDLRDGRLVLADDKKNAVPVEIRLFRSAASLSAAAEAAWAALT